MPDYYFISSGFMQKMVLSEVSDFVRQAGNLPIPESQPHRAQSGIHIFHKHLTMNNLSNPHARLLFHFHRAYPTQTLAFAVVGLPTDDHQAGSL